MRLLGILKGRYKPFERHQIDSVALAPLECGRNRQTAGPLTSSGRLSGRVMGSPHDKGGQWFWVHGLRPGEQYWEWTVGPDGKRYGYHVAQGQADEDGAASGARWDPYLIGPGRILPDRQGHYAFHLLTADGEELRLPWVLIYPPGVKSRLYWLWRVLLAVARKAARAVKLRQVLSYARGWFRNSKRR